MKYVYHFKRKSMQGEVLYPLNTLKEKFPETFDNHASKYKGREVIMERVIPSLDCLWNDVIHLAPINPQLILDKWDELGYKIPNLEFEVFKIPVSILEESNVIYFDPHLRPYGNFEFVNEQVREFKTDSYSELEAISDHQVEIWKQDKQEGRPMFWYSHTTHVLYKGSIDTTNLEVFTCK